MGVNILKVQKAFMRERLSETMVRVYSSAGPIVGLLPIEAASLFGRKMNPQGTWPGTLLCMQCVARFKLAINYPIKTDRNAHQEFQPISPSF